MCLNPGDLINGRYETIQQLGRGGFGITYTAYDTWRSSNIVVLKQISIANPNINHQTERDTSYITKLEAEAKVLQELKHPCIPEFFESFEADDYYYIVQEYIEGHDLSQEILPGEPIGELAAINILKEILAILQFVHQHNIIHRDIKPANIIRRYSDNRLFLIDFGAVKEVATEHTIASGVTLTRVIYAKGYTPAEQMNGHPRQNSDIYALGIMIMQAVTGFSPNAIYNPQAIPLRDSQCNYIWQKYAPQISRKFKKIISKTIAYSFSDRYQTASEVLLAIDSLAKTSLWDRIKHFSEKNLIKKRKLIKFLAVAITACCLLILLSNNPFYSNNLCSSLGDNISCGEEILDPLSKGSIRFRAAQDYNNKQYQKASAEYQLSWQKERRDAESLIYLNNSLLEASKLDYYTIAVAVPLSSNEKISIHNSKLAQQFLRGVAQAQTEVNLSLANQNAIFKLLPGELLDKRNITNNSNKGLKVIIVDDGNNIEQARQTAQSLVKMPSILGIVGNYASEMTLATVDIYEQNNLAQISFGTTTKRLTTNHRRNFFRVVYTNKEEAETVVKYIQSIDVSNKKVAGFYNPNSPFSNYFWIEIRDRLKEINIPIYKAFNLADENFNTQLALKEANLENVNIYLLLPDGQVTNALSNAIEVIELDAGKSFIVGGNSIVLPEVTQLNTPLSQNLAASVFWHPFAPQNPQFLTSSRQLWNATIDKGTAVAYDAAIALIKAIELQAKPTRKGTIAQLADPEFVVEAGATGSIKFNTPRNGDRKDFYPTLVRLFKCEATNHFVPLSLEPVRAKKLACQTEDEI